MRAPLRCLVAIATLCFAATTVHAQDDPNYVLSVGNGVTSPGGSVSLPVLLDSTGSDIQGWSFGICLDETQISVDSAALGVTTQTVKLGDPPDFEQINIEPGGWTMGVVICLFACASLPPGNGYELAVADYTALAPEGTNIQLCPCSDVGVPVINAVVVIDGISIHPVKVCGNVQVQPLVPFVRSDVNGDGFHDLSDGIFLLNFLFQGGPIFDCPEANDVNGDGGIDTGDPIYIILYYFAGGVAPPAPFPSCGLLPDQTLADCQVFPACP
jgi:hypothetical protein